MKVTMPFLLFAVASAFAVDARIEEARRALRRLHAYMDPNARPWYDVYLWFVDGMVAHLEGDLGQRRILAVRLGAR